MLKLTFALVLLATPADACHRFSVWRYPYPQRCGLRVVQLEAPPAPAPEPKPPEPPEADIPLPSLENMVFPPDTTDEAGQRLKGIGLLRELRGTN
jgi:hypothetical protein